MQRFQASPGVRVLISTRPGGRSHGEHRRVMMLAVGCLQATFLEVDMAIALTLLLLSGLAANGTSQPLSPDGRVNLAQAFTPPAEIRHDTSLVDGWRFIKSDV